MNIVKWCFYGMIVENKHHPFLRVSQRFKSIYTLQGIKPDNTTHASDIDTMSGHSS
jgi:hypothetical protein